MDRKIRIGAVSYLNTKPLIYGLRDKTLESRIDIIQDYPSRIAAKLENDEIDVGLVPVAIIPRLAESHIVTDFCIGCDGPVDSVAIFSEQPLEKVKRLMLDYQSRTSVMLTRVLLREYWKISPELVDTRGEEYLDDIRGDAAGLVIGDRALAQKKKSAFMYDLGAAWKSHTGLPFVFAAWVSNKTLDSDFLSRFNAANAIGLSALDKVIAEEKNPPADLETYYTKNISYRLDSRKRKGLELFLSKLKDYSPARTPGA